MGPDNGGLNANRWSRAGGAPRLPRDRTTCRGLAGPGSGGGRLQEKAERSREKAACGKGQEWDMECGFYAAGGFLKARPESDSSGAKGDCHSTTQ